MLGAAALVATGVVQADSGVGVDTMLGNALNSYPRRPEPPKDPDGMGITLHPRTPTGFLNYQPNAVSEPSQQVDGWLYSLFIEAGALGGDGNTKAAYFRTYKDVENGFLLNNFRVTAEKPANANFAEAFGGGAGRDDQYYGARFGRYNDWKVQLFYQETTHVFTDTFKKFWNGIGTGNLTLPASNPPAAGATCANPPTCTTFTSPALGLNTPTAQAAVNVAAARALDGTVRNADNTEIGLIRKKGGLRADLWLTDTLKLYFSGSSEKRTGARPFGATWAAGGGAGNVETVEPIDYNTHDVVVGAEYSDDRNSFNASISGSFFRNNIDTLTFQNPYLPATALGNNGALFTGGRYDLYPDNNFYNVKTEYARLIPEFYNTRLTAVLSASTLRQNDDLIPSTQFSGVSGGIAGGSWDTVNSLTQKKSNARIDTKLADFGATISPLSSLDVRGKFRFYETSNKTSYTACNPLIGQFGRLVNDGTGQALVSFTNDTGTALSPAQLAATNAFLASNNCNKDSLTAYVAANRLAPNSGNLQIQNVPYEYRQYIYNVAADYRLNRKNTVTLSAEREVFDREHRERDETWEDKAKVAYTNRSLQNGTVRVSAEYDRRRGSEYHPDPNEETFYSAAFGIPTATGSTASLTNWIHNIDQFRKFDLADRDQVVVNGRFNYAVREDLDIGFSGQFRNARFPDSQFGRNGRQRLNSASVDLNWQPAQTVNVYASYSYQEAHTQQRGDWPNACVLGSRYFFYSNGVVQAAAAGAPTPATPAGTTLLATQLVTPTNFYSVCAVSSDFSPLYPTSRAWNVSQDDRNHALSLGFNYDFSRARLSVDYQYSRGRTGVAYDYNGAALGLTPAQVAGAGSGWPDMLYSQHTINTSLLVPINKTVSTRFFWAYELGRISDWHYDGVASNPTGGAGTGYNVNSLFLDTGPTKWKTNLFGVLLRIKL